MSGKLLLMVSVFFMFPAMGTEICVNNLSEPENSRMVCHGDQGQALRWGLYRTNPEMNCLRVIGRYVSSSDGLGAVEQLSDVIPSQETPRIVVDVEGDMRGDISTRQVHITTMAGDNETRRFSYSGSECNISLALSDSTMQVRTGGGTAAAPQIKERTFRVESAPSGSMGAQ